MGELTILVNRAPVLTLWAAVVAERLGFEREAALTMGKAVAGLNAQSKGRMLGIFGAPKARDGAEPKKVGLGEEFWVEICGRGVPAKKTVSGVRAVVKDQPIEPASVERYLAAKFGAHLMAVRQAMQALAGAFEARDLADKAYGLYEQFRPSIPSGTTGWGAKGELSLERIRALGRKT